jgi:acetyl-CoA carboxylase carboxyl transferase subunit alpha
MSLAFEKPINELQARIDDMRTFVTEQGVDLSSEIKVLEERLEQLKRDIYTDLTRWQRVQAARASGRPTALDYIHGTFNDFNELHGDRTLGDDAAIVTGLAELDGTSVVIIGQQKGRDTKENIQRNFGMAHPSGYRKAMRMFDLADKFQLPVITLIDTPGAYPGIAAEEQGQAWVIAESIQRMSRLTVPAISVVIGEGGSGGALAVAVANRVLILENSIYSVISPESCAAILWRDASQAEHAAEALKLTAQDLLSLDVVDAIIKEPLGGAHRNPDKMVRCLGETLGSELNKLMQFSERELLEQRYERFRKLGRVTSQEGIEDSEGVRALESGEDN